jgi:plastocyanin
MTDRSGFPTNVRSNAKLVSHVLRKSAKWEGFGSFPMQGMPLGRGPGDAARIRLFHSKALDTDDSFSFTVAKAGTYGYSCGLHPRMQGRIVVTLEARGIIASA